MRISHGAVAFLITLAVGLAGGSTAQTPADEAGFVKIKPADFKWVSNPSRPGLQSIVLAGDPTKPGLYMIRVKFPPGMMTRPHTHPNDRLVTVISGTWYAGTGDKFDPDKTDPMPPGSFMKHPAKAAHYDGAKTEEVIVQITGMGPAPTEYVNPADDPSRRNR